MKRGLKIITADGRGVSPHARPDVTYSVGCVTMAPDWNPEPVCGGGIHYAEMPDDWLPELEAHHIVVEVEPVGETVRICDDKTKAEGVRVLRVIPFEELAEMGEMPISFRIDVVRRVESQATLERLCSDSDWSVREVVAERVTSQAVLERLCKDSDWCVRVAAAQRVESQAVLERLCDDDIWRVRIAAADRLKSLNKHSKNLRGKNNDAT